MNAQDPFEGQHDTPGKGAFDDAGVDRGSAWAALDESFFRIVNDLFTPTYRLGAEILLSSNDNAVARRVAIPRQPVEYEAPHEDDTEQVIDLTDDTDSEARAAARRAAMRRHPSSWRRLH